MRRSRLPTSSIAIAAAGGEVKVRRGRLDRKALSEAKAHSEAKALPDHKARSEDKARPDLVRRQGLVVRRGLEVRCCPGILAALGLLGLRPRDRDRIRPQR